MLQEPESEISWSETRAEIRALLYSEQLGICQCPIAFRISADGFASKPNWDTAEGTMVSLIQNQSLKSFINHYLISAYLPYIQCIFALV